MPFSAADTHRKNAAQTELALIAADPQAFLRGPDDPQAKGGPITLPDGAQVPRLPSVRRWMWDQGDFCGSIGLRWPADLGVLPPHVLGHIGYAVVPWQRGRGHATRALGMMLPEARVRGLAAVKVTTDFDNLASQKVITANGGVWVERFTKPVACGSLEAWRYRIQL